MIVRMNQAGNGDCILVDGGVSKILVDGGTAASFDEWKLIFSNISILDCLFITHIDDDHVNGVLKLIENDDLVKIESVIFNGAKQVLELDINKSSEDDYCFEALVMDFSPVPDEEVEIGYSEATSLSYILEEKEYSVNEKNYGKAIHADSFSKPINIGCFEIEFLGPTRDSLIRLKERWFDILSERGLQRKIITKKHSKAFEAYVNELRGDDGVDVNISQDIYDSIEKLSESIYRPDKSLANETSLSFIMRANEKSILMLGDAHAETIIEWMNEKGLSVLSVDAVKVSHHGSSKNINKELIERLRCGKYFISTNGKRFLHPDVEVIAKIARYSSASNTKIYINNKIPHISDEFIARVSSYNNTVEIIFGTDGVVL